MLTKNSKNYQHTKHINIWYYYIWEKEKDDMIVIDYLPIEEMIADKLTKAYTPTKIKIFVK